MMFMKKLLLITTIFFIFLCCMFVFNKASADECNLVINSSILTTSNYKKTYSNNFLKNIQKICTNDICTYNFDNNFENLFSMHLNKVVDNEKDYDKKTVMKLQGAKINEIHLKSCI